MLFSMSRALQRFAVSCSRVPSTIAAQQSRGLRTKKQIILERNKASLNWAKRFQEDQQEGTTDEKAEPHEIHIVFQTATLNGRPYWEKDIMAELGFTHKMKRILVKNTPHYNDMLREVKHLVRMLPLKFPHGVPTDPADFERSYINSRGELVVRHTLHPSEEAAVPRDEPNKWEMRTETYKKELQRKLELQEVHEEFYEEEHKWKLNEDGKEHRYNFNKDIPKHKPMY